MKKSNLNKYNYLLKNTFLFTIANFSNKLIVFFLLPFYTAFLSTEEYAIIDIISVIQQLIFPIITLDITEAIIRFGVEKNNNKRSILDFGFLFVVIGNLFLSLVCLILIYFNIEIRAYILYFLLFSFVISINTLLSSFFRTVDRINFITISSIVNTLVVAISNIILIAKFKMGVDGYYISFIFGNLVGIIVMLFGFKNLDLCNSLSKNDMKILLKKMLLYSIPLIPNALFWWVNSSLDRLFLSTMSGLTFVGMYAAANKIPSILSTITSIFQQSWGLSSFKENESSSKKEFFNVIYNFYNEFLFLISFGLIAVIKYVSYFLLSKDFFEGWIIVPFLVLAFYFNSISSFLGTEFTAAKKTGWVLFTTFISAIINIIFNIILIYKFDCVGAAIATVISYFVMVIIRIYLLNNKFDFNIKIGSFFIKSFILVVCCLSVILLKPLYHFLLVFVLFVYICFNSYKYYIFIFNKIIGIIKK